MFFVYKITNKINNKVYIGKSKDPLKRFRIHLKIAKGGKEKYPRKFQAIHAAIVKYGIYNFYFEIIKELETESESFDFEMKTILELKENKIPNYNLSDGGEGNSGWHHTDEAKKKMSIARRGKKFTTEHKLALSMAQSGELHSQYGKHQSIEWKENKGKLTAIEIAIIKKLLQEGIAGRKLAKLYNVSEATISLIKHHKIWPEVKSSN